MALEKDSDRVIPAGEFKARCLQLMDEVNMTQRAIVITKRGKPVAKLVPVAKKRKSTMGCMEGRFEIVGDIVAPIFPTEEWECFRK